ncbi:MAG: antitoxin MazE family protein [Rhodoplanes sp.]|uniref:antitoxin MazE family protein n=1 Tax=Rhodoplanes sp. TaxID=1968906 RepID=UPI001796C0FF|nr:antitoxin MazE family protein [Rhodoplanes sp.]NVO12997.1 antitoxin MazE family protein [Rhodoplanes sp.]
MSTDQPKPGTPLRRKAVRVDPPDIPAKSDPAARASTRQKVSAHRRRLRAKGYRLVQMWLPDTRTDTFASRAREESAALASHPNEADDQAFVDAVSWLTSDDDVSMSETARGSPWWRIPEAGE